MKPTEIKIQIKGVIRCLKELDIYSPYINNFNQHRNGRLKGSNIFECLSASINEFGYCPLNSTAIGWHWDESNEGLGFWREQSEKLEKMLQQYMCKQIYNCKNS